MKVISRIIRVDTGVDHSFCEFTDERKKRDGAKVFEEFIVELQRF